jgi:hypothetical protein
MKISTDFRQANKEIKLLNLYQGPGILRTSDKN